MLIKSIATLIAGFVLLVTAQATQAQGLDNAASGGSTVILGPRGIAPGQYIVVFKDSVADPAAAAGDLARRHGLGLRFVYSTALKGFSASVPAAALTGLRADPRIAYVEADQLVHLFAQSAPTGINRIFAPGNPAIDIDSNDDFRVDVDVAVIDTGIDYDHPDLNVVARTNCSGGSAFPPITCDDDTGDDGHGHGTHVAGTIGALDNGIGVVGVAPGARLWAVKVLSDSGSGYISWIVAGIDWVTARADQIEVANMSLGCECSSAALNTAIANSVNAGVVHVVAAGNSDKNASTFSPANHPDVITVSALADFNGAPGGGAAYTCRADEDDTLANFSNWGNLVEVAAPGVCILSSWKAGGYNTISGTSMASPHVAGAAALLASGPNGPTNETQALAIRQAIIDEGNPGWVDDSGDGIQEPLLDVHSFSPTLIATAQPPPANTAPTVSVVTPAEGVTVGGTVTIGISASDADAAGTLNVDWRIDGNGPWLDTIYNNVSGRYEASWDTTSASDGGHVIEAQATDSGAMSGGDSNNVTVDNSPVAPAYVSVADPIVCFTSGGRNNSKHLNVPITILDGLSQGVGGVNVAIHIERDLGGLWNGAGTTGGTGTVTFVIQNAKPGNYTTTVTGVTGSGIVWDGDQPIGNTCVK